MIDDDKFLSELANSEVVDRNSVFLQAGVGKAVIKGYKKFDAKRSGSTVTIDVVVIDVKPKDGQTPNNVGETATMMYQFEVGSPDRRSAVTASFKRDLCAILGEDVATISQTKLGQLLKTAADTQLVGVPFTFDSYYAGYDTKAKDGKPAKQVHYHRVRGIPVGKEKLLDLKAKVLAGAKVEEYGI